MEIKYSEIENKYDSEKSKNVKKMVILRLATLNYEVENNKIRVKIIVNSEENEINEIIIRDEDLNDKEIKQIRESFLVEPIIGRFDLLPQKEVSSLIERLEDYKKNLEYENKEEFYIKQFHSKKNYNKYYKNKKLERNECGRIWIDYEKQKKNKSYIYNIEGGAGCWATYMDYYEKVHDNIERYGDKVLVLKRYKNIKYIKLDKEIIGNIFKVEKIYDISEELEKKLIKDGYLTSKTKGIIKYKRWDIEVEEEKIRENQKCIKGISKYLIRILKKSNDKIKKFFKL